MPIKIKTCVRAVAAALTLGIVTSGCASSSQPPVDAAPLHAMLGQNGLYVSAESYSETSNDVSIIDTVYDDLTLHNAGTTAPAWQSPVAATKLAEFAAKNPIWGQWFTSQAQHTGAQPALRVDTATISGAYQPAGFYSDTTQQAGDPVADTASTWAAVQALAGSGTRIPTATRTALTHWLTARSAHISFPIQACQLAQSLTALGSPLPLALANYGPSWLATHPAATISDMTALADLYGATCAATAAHTLPQATTTRLTAVTTPYLTGRSYTALQRYYLTGIWRALGQDRRPLATLADSARTELGPQGAAHAHTTLTGGLMPTFLAVEIEKTADTYLDTPRIPAVVKALADTNPTSDPLDYLAGSATLCELHACAGGNASKIASALTHLPRAITVYNIDDYATARRLLQILGGTYPAVTFEHFDTSNPAGLHALIMATGFAPGDGSTQPLPTSTLVTGLRQGTAPFDDPTTRSTALDILAARHALDPTTVRAVRNAIGHLSACADMPQLSTVQATGQAPQCDLAATMETLLTRQSLT